MIFDDGTEMGVEVHASPKRQPPIFDVEAMRLLRGRTFHVYQLTGMALGDIARTFNFSVRKVQLDLAHYRAQTKAEGRTAAPLNGIDD